MKKQKHFESEQAIIDAIDHVKARHTSLTDEAVRLEHASDHGGIGPADEDRLKRIKQIQPAHRGYNPTQAQTHPGRV